MMKRLIYTLALLLGSLGVQAQTAQPNLPSGSERYSQTLWIAPDSTLWTGKGGNYTRVATNKDLRDLAANGYTRAQVDSILNDDYYTKIEVDDKLTLAPKSFNIIGVSDGDGPILTFNPGDWDENFREIGNTIFVSDSGKYYTTYTGYEGDYNETDVYIGLAYSYDGKVWFKAGKITPIGHEDPYLMHVGGEFYLYTELKENGPPDPHKGIHLYKGEDLLSMADMGLVLTQTGSGWESRDVSSPTLIFINSTFYLMYEGRSSSQLGAIGLATSSDGVNFNRVQTEPIISGTNINGDVQWCSHLVPDDIIQLDGKYYLTYHGYTGNVFSQGLVASADMIEWYDLLGSWIGIGISDSEAGGDGTSLYIEDGRLTAMYTASTPVRGIYKGYYSVKTGQNTSYKKMVNSGFPNIYPANRNGYLDFNYIGAKILKKDFNSGAGIVKNIKNTSPSPFYIRPESGVTLNGGTSDYTLGVNETVTLISTGPNSWLVWQHPITINAADTIDNLNRSTFYRQSSGSGNLGISITNPNDVRYGLQIESTNYNASSLRSRVRGTAGWGPYNYIWGSTGTLRRDGFDTAPSSSTATGTAGEIRITTDYIYICTATNTWKRVAISTW